MLVLTRKVGERIVIGNNISVVINRIAGNRISLGVDAPRHVRVVRGELAEEEQPLDDPGTLLPAVPSVDHPALDFGSTAVVHRAR